LLYFDFAAFFNSFLYGWESGRNKSIVRCTTFVLQKGIERNGESVPTPTVRKTPIWKGEGFSDRFTGAPHQQASTNKQNLKVKLKQAKLIF
jgi:hypothetical protein